MEQKLGRVLMQTVIEVPTKHVKGVQRYKRIATWVSIPHEFVELSLLHRLKKAAQTALGAYVDLEVMQECQTAKVAHYLDEIGPIRNYRIRGEIIFTNQKEKQHDRRRTD